LNLTELGWEPRQLQHLEHPFSEQEIENGILLALKEKAPGSDGFIGLFFSTCWIIIKTDLLNAIKQFSDMNSQGLPFLNNTFVVLIPKKFNPQRVSDYRSISLIHIFAKLISKFLANRLSPELEFLISAN
jgi:hypothetical protein